MDILVYGLSERKRALRTARIASSEGYTVVDAEVETRSARSPDETALDGDAIGERPLPELESVVVAGGGLSRSSPVLQTGRQHPNSRLALPHVKKIHPGIFPDKIPQHFVRLHA